MNDRQGAPPSGSPPRPAKQEGTTFQPDSALIRWRVHFASPPPSVFRALATARGRKQFWAESAEEAGDTVHFKVPGGLESRGRILERTPDRRFVVEYFGWIVEFELRPASGSAGTDLEMTCRHVPPADRTEVIAGWVSVLLAMKAAVDFGVDLRNHDPARSWWNGYADN